MQCRYYIIDFGNVVSYFYGLVIVLSGSLQVLTLPSVVKYTVFVQ